MTRPIDSIVVTEMASRFHDRKRQMTNGEFAAAALLWFHRFMPESHLIGVHANVAGPDIANNTEVIPYVQRAADSLKGEILKRAINLAQADLDRAEQFRKNES